MSEFKNSSNEEKITHYLAGELSEDEKVEFELELKKDSSLNSEFKNSQALIALLNADKNSITIEGGIGVERINNIFGNHSSQHSDKSVLPIAGFFKYRKFTLVAAALILLSYSFLPNLWKTSADKTTPVKLNSEDVVQGARSFNMGLPSGTYFFTLKNGSLIINKIESLEGDDYFKKAGAKAGDHILKINGINTASFKSDQLSSLLKSLVNESEVYLELRRNGQVIPTNHIQPKN